MKRFEQIKNRFNKIKKELEEKKIANIGTEELEKKANDLLGLQEDITNVKTEARTNVEGVSIDDLAEIFKESEEMWAEIETVYKEVDEVFEDKRSQVAKLTAEVERHNNIIRMYEKKIASYNRMIKYDESLLNQDDLESELMKLVNIEFEFETKKIEKLQELIEKHVEVCKDINVDINILKYGGEPRKKSSKKEKGETDYDAMFKDGNKFEKDDQDHAFAEGLTKDNFDKVFAGGVENLVGVGTVEEPAPVELSAPIEEDGDLAELVVPDLGDGPAKEAEEIIPVEVETAPEVEETKDVELSAPIEEPVPVEETPAPVAEVVTEAAAVELSAPIAEETPAVEQAQVVTPEPVVEPAPVVETPAVEATPEEKPVELSAPIEESATVEEAAASAIASVEAAAPAPQEPAPVELSAPIAEEEHAEEIPNSAAPAQEGVVQDIDWDKWDNFFDETFSKNNSEDQGKTLTL